MYNRNNLRKMKTAVVVGHHLLSKGAYSNIWGYEWDLMKEISKGLNCDTFIHNPSIRGYNARQRAMAKRTKMYENVFELHFNGSHPEANGCEALYWFKNEKGKAISQLFCDMVEKDMGMKNRGAKAIYSKKQRGYGFIAFTHGTSILLEPFFGSNQKDCLKFEKDNYINILNTLIASI